MIPDSCRLSYLPVNFDLLSVSKKILPDCVLLLYHFEHRVMDYKINLWDSLKIKGAKRVLWVDAIEETLLMEGSLKNHYGN